MEERYYSERYFRNCPIDLTSNNPRTYAIKKSGSGKKILEIGTSTGEISQILQENGNIVTGIEIDIAAAKKAERFCSRMITGNVEEMDFSLLFGVNKFDVIILTDVIEHLIWPERLLKRLHQLLDKLGFLIISIPNFCHKDILLNLMRGDFHYTDIGLLDATHLRFFGLKNIGDLFKNSKFEIRDMNKIIMEKTEQSDTDIFVPESLKSFVDSIPESNVYQYVFLAYPSDEPNDYPLPTCLLYTSEAETV